MEERNERVFRHRRGSLTLGRRTRLMGIVNVTPDSFSDGGRFLESVKAVDHALLLIADGAEMIDLGAESTRAGSQPVSEDVQLERLLPVLEKIRPVTGAILSIDTRSPKVAKECLLIGADTINDVSGLRDNSDLADVCAKAGSGLIVMHMRGAPQTMQNEPHYQDVVSVVRRSLHESVEFALRCGMEREQVLVDPGLGFGKSFIHNYNLLHALKSFQGLGAGVLIGPSRKAFTGEFSGLPAESRQYSTAATVAISILNGADIVRVHDVNEMRQVADICDRYKELAHEQA